VPSTTAPASFWESVTVLGAATVAGLAAGAFAQALRENAR